MSSLAIPSTSELAETITSIFSASIDAASTATGLPLAAKSPETDKALPTVGPIPLAAFIPMCFFTPFVIGFTLWLLYIYTIKRWKEKKKITPTETQGKGPQVDLGRDVEMQVESFINAPPLVKPKARRKKDSLSLEPVQEEGIGILPPEFNRTDSALRWNQFHFNAL